MPSSSGHDDAWKYGERSWSPEETGRNIAGSGRAAAAGERSVARTASTELQLLRGAIFR
jgi:hypothetical protein